MCPGPGAARLGLCWRAFLCVTSAKPPVCLRLLLWQGEEALLLKQDGVVKIVFLSLDAWRVPLKVSPELLMVCQVNNLILQHSM